MAISIGGPINPAKAAQPACNAAKARAEHDRQIDDIGTGQEVAERKGLVEFVRRHPAVLVDDAAPRPDQHAAEAGQRHLGEGDKQLNQAGRDGRGLGAGRSGSGAAAGGELGMAKI